MPRLSPPTAPLASPLGVAAAVLACGIAAAEPPELVTDRPDQTESAEVVPRGWVQLETGWGLTGLSGEAAAERRHEVPGTLVRIGATRNLELRLGWTGFVFEDSGAPGSTEESEGTGDSELGAKLVLRRGQGTRPQIALLMATTLPTGEEGITTDRLDPSFRLSLAHELSEGLGVGYNLGLAWESEEAAAGQTTTLSDLLYTLAFGVSLGPRWGAFAEVFGEIPLSAAGGPVNSLDAGLTYLVRSNLQLDLAAGLGLSAAADDWFVGLGVSVRWPQ